ncbi:hypothetical protein [Sphingopyxis sp. 550A]
MTRSALDVRTHPFRSGLVWAAIYLPLMLLINLLLGNQLSERQIIIMALLAVPAGILWGYSTKFVLKGGSSRAR